MSSSNLIRWSGLAAAVAGGLFIIVALIDLFVLGFGQNFTSSGLLFRSAVSGIAGALVVLGLVGLYAYQSEATGIPGLISVLMISVGTVMVAQGFIWTALLTDLGWILFGATCLRAGVYPRIAALLIIIGAVIVGVFSHLINALIVGGPGGILAYTGIGASIVLYVAIAWLGLILLGGREQEYQTRRSPRSRAQ
jgi:hypothetical protein